MPADEHIGYVPELPSVDYRIVILAAIASLLLVAGAIGRALRGLSAVGAGQRRTGTANIFTAARGSVEELGCRADATCIPAKTAARNLAMGRPAAHVGANSDRARHANTCPAWQ